MKKHMTEWLRVLWLHGNTQATAAVADVAADAAVAAVATNDQKITMKTSWAFNIAHIHARTSQHTSHPHTFANMNSLKIYAIAIIMYALNS